MTLTGEGKDMVPETPRENHVGLVIRSTQLRSGSDRLNSTQMGELGRLGRRTCQIIFVTSLHTVEVPLGRAFKFR